MEMWESLAGPIGGAIAGGYGLGAVSGYQFAQKAIISEAKSRITKLEGEIHDLQKEVKELLRGK